MSLWGGIRTNAVSLIILFNLRQFLNYVGICDLVRIMYDKDTGRSRGFGFVHFSKDVDARSAKDAMDGKVSRSWLLLYTWKCFS